MLANAIFARACVDCPSDPPDCKECPSGQMCTLSVQTCQKCPEAKCVPSDDQSTSHAGAIAGGVVGGLIGLGFIIGGVLWFKYRHRRRRHLQRLQQQLSDLTPPDSPSYGELPELKAPSINTNAESQMLPIEIHFNQTPFGNSYNANGPPTIRESIRESEYSFGSENVEGSENNGGLRHYDVAVQGRANLVNLDKSKRQRPQPPASRLAQGQLYDIVEHNESAILAPTEPPGPPPVPPPRPQSRRFSRQASQLQSRQSTRPPSVQASSRPPSTQMQSSQRASSLQSDVLTHDAPQNVHRLTAHASSQEPPNRFSRASSREYVADLPDEVRLYESNGLFEG